MCGYVRHEYRGLEETPIQAHAARSFKLAKLSLRVSAKIEDLVTMGPRAAPNPGTMGPRAAPNPGTMGPRAAPNPGTMGPRAAPNPGTMGPRAAPNPRLSGWRLDGADRAPQPRRNLPEP